MRNVLILALAAILAGCSGHNSSGTVTIPFKSLDKRTFSDLPEEWSDGRTGFVVTDTGNNESMMYADIDEILYKDSKIYILDWKYKKLVVYKDDGTPCLSLMRQGRGPQEYLQISNFAVDNDGSIWINDGQSDRLLHYGSDGSFISATDLPFEINFLRCLNNGKFLIGLASWDTSEYKGKKVLLTDKDLNVEASCLDFGITDPNFSFPSPGFTECGDGLTYNYPIDDCVYRFNSDGSLSDKVYFFDFGNRSVPEEARKDVFSHFSEFKNYTMLEGPLYISDDTVVGVVYDSGIDKAFIIDRDKGIVYLQDEKHSGISLAGISGGYAVFRIPAGIGDGLPEMPDSAKDALDSGADVFMMVRLD